MSKTEWIVDKPHSSDSCLPLKLEKCAQRCRDCLRQGYYAPQGPRNFTYCNGSRTEDWECTDFVRLGHGL